ncbi:MAG: hypothetical protein WEB59_11980 [Thermoanaerobaculia bacterium]
MNYQEHRPRLVAAEGGGAEVRIRIPLTRAQLLGEAALLRGAAPVSQAS